MDRHRLRPAEWVLTAGAAALVVSLFLPWYDLGRAGTTFTGWEAFAAVDVILVACAAVALVAVFLQATQQTPALPVIGGVAATWLGIAALVIVALNVVDRPDRFADTRYGAWIGLAATVALAAGGWWAIRDERARLRVQRSHLESSG
jgi:peptidoglycan biosynthesis protein MviN/MurJ (putative lipid II flippase)